MNEGFTGRRVVSVWRQALIPDGRTDGRTGSDDPATGELPCDYVMHLIGPEVS